MVFGFVSRSLSLLAVRRHARRGVSLRENALRSIARRKKTQLCGALVLCIFATVIAFATATQKDVTAQIETMSGLLDMLKTNQDLAFNKLKTISHLSDSVVLTGPTVIAHPGDTVSWPVTLANLSFVPAALNVDLVLPAGVSFVSTSAGESATTAGKLVQSAVTNGVPRVIVFGINQTVIPEGVVFIVTLKVDATAGARQYPVGMSNATVSDKSGNPILVSTVSGNIVAVKP